MAAVSDSPNSSQAISAVQGGTRYSRLVTAVAAPRWISRYSSELPPSVSAEHRPGHRADQLRCQSIGSGSSSASGSVTDAAPRAAAPAFAVRTSHGATKRFWYSVPAVMPSSASSASARLRRRDLAAAQLAPDAPAPSPARPSSRPSHWRADTAPRRAPLRRASARAPSAPAAGRPAAPPCRRPCPPSPPPRRRRGSPRASARRRRPGAATARRPRGQARARQCDPDAEAQRPTARSAAQEAQRRRVRHAVAGDDEAGAPDQHEDPRHRAQPARASRWSRRLSALGADFRQRLLQVVDHRPDRQHRRRRRSAPVPHSWVSITPNSVPSIQQERDRDHLHHGLDLAQHVHRHAARGADLRHPLAQRRDRDLAADDDQRHQRVRRGRGAPAPAAPRRPGTCRPPDRGRRRTTTSCSASAPGSRRPSRSARRRRTAPWPTRFCSRRLERQVEHADDQRNRDDARPGQERRQVEEHAADCAELRATPARRAFDQCSSVRGLKRALVVEQEGLAELPRLGQARHVAERRGAAHRVDRRSAVVSLRLARLAQDLDAAHAAVGVELDLEHRDRQQRIGHARRCRCRRDWPRRGAAAACWRTSVQLRTPRGGGSARRVAARLRGDVGRVAPAAVAAGGAGCRGARSDAGAAGSEPARPQRRSRRRRRAGRSQSINAAHGRSPRPVRAKCPRRSPGPRRSRAPTPRTPPKRCSSRARFFGPTPAMSSSLLPPVRTLARRARMPVMAKRCASSRICATSISAAESRPSATLSRPSANTSSSSPTLRPSPFSTPTISDRSRPSSSNTSRAMPPGRAAVDQHQVGQARACAAARRASASLA